MDRINIIQLVLYHLHITEKTGVGYFRWKEDICRLIEERWDQLCPTKSRTASWMNSVSSVLSANTSAFESGFERLKQPGWWALKHIQPPRPSPMSLMEPKLKRKRTEEDEVVDVGEEDFGPILPSRSPATVDTAHTLLFAKHFADRIPNVSALLPHQQEATPTTVKAAQEIKRKLVERLLKVDSRLLQEALSSAPAMPFVRSSTPPQIGQLSSEFAMNSGIPPSQDGISLEVDCKDLKSKMSPSLKELRKMQKATRPANYVRASPHENELLETCLRVSNPDHVMNRLKRKLIVRRTKRRVGLLVFDIDSIMYLYLKCNDPLTLPNDEQLVESHTGIIKTSETEVEPKTFFEIPYHRDPSLSFLAKLNGISNTIPGYPLEFVSPFSGLRLPSFLYRDYETKPAKVQLFEELTDSVSRYDADETLAYDLSPIDYINVRKEWLPQVNRLLRRFFWPSVDMVEMLDTPDYGVLALYRKLVVGCVFLTPDGYMTYFFVHPEWSKSGIGSTLLYLLLSKVAPKHLDITLHVSVTNPALLLYQRFGFKPEEYIVNFYDKYFREDDETVGVMSSHSKNAYFIRFRR